MADDPPFIGGDDGADNLIRVAAQIASDARKVLDDQAHAATRMTLRTFAPTVLVESVRALPDNDLAQLINLARESQSQEQFDKAVQKNPQAGLVGLLSKQENRRELYEFVKTVAEVVAAGAVVTQCATLIDEKPAIIQQTPPAAQPLTPPQRPTPPTEKL